MGPERDFAQVGCPGHEPVYLPSEIHLELVQAACRDDHILDGPGLARGWRDCGLIGDRYGERLGSQISVESPVRTADHEGEATVDVATINAAVHVGEPVSCLGFGQGARKVVGPESGQLLIQQGIKVLETVASEVSLEEKVIAIQRES